MSIINCPNCGKQYHYNNQFAGQQVRCQACGNMFQMPVIKDDGLELVPVEPAGSGHAPSPGAGKSTGPKTADEIDYQLFGDDMQFAEVTLDPGEMVIAEAGAMMFMTSGIKMETVFGDPSQKGQGFWGKMMSAGKRVLTGESLFMTTYSNIAQRREVVAFAAPYPGKIIPLHL